MLLNMKFSTVFYAIFAVLVLHAILMVSKGYYLFNDIDIAMHLLGGFVMGMLALAIHHSASKNSNLKRVPAWYLYLFVVGFAMFIGVAWEAHEYLIDQTLTKWFDWPLSQLSLTDTMGDFLNDWVGATVCFFFFQRRT
jgi:hypothetical protein